MLQANLYDESLGLSGGGLGLWNPITAVKDAGSYLVDKTVDGAKSAYSATKTAGSYVVDKVCSTATDPRVQMIAQGASLYPPATTYTGAVMATGAACQAFYPASMPGIPGPSPTAYAMPFLVSSIPAMTRAPITPAIPTGSIAAYDPKRGGYRVAVPGPPRLSGLAGLAAAFTEVGVQANLPVTARLVSLATFDKETGAEKPWYKKPLVLAGIGAGVLAVGAGAVVLRRR